MLSSDIVRAIPKLLQCLCLLLFVAPHNRVCGTGVDAQTGLCHSIQCM